MNDDAKIKEIFFDTIKFTISVMALCLSSTYFFDVAYSYAIEGFPLLAAVKHNFTLIYLLWVVGLVIWLKIEEKGLAFAISLIMVTSDYFGRLLGYRMLEDVLTMNKIAVRITAIFVVVILMFGYLRYKYRDSDTRLLHYLILASCTLFFSCINDVGLLDFGMPVINFIRVKDFMIGVYVPWCAGIMYVCEILMYDKDIIRS